MRHLTAADIDELCALERRCFSDAWSRQSLLFELTDEHRIYIGLFDGQQLTAAAGLFFLLDTGEILTVATDPAYRRHGLAKTLLHELLDSAKKKGLKTLHLEVRVSNAAAITLYEALGFVTVSRRRNYYEQPAEDALVLQKTI